MAALKETAGSYMNGDGTVALSLARSEESKLSVLAKIEQNRGSVLALRTKFQVIREQGLQLVASKDVRCHLLWRPSYCLVKITSHAF